MHSFDKNKRMNGILRSPSCLQNISGVRYNSDIDQNFVLHEIMSCLRLKALQRSAKPDNNIMDKLNKLFVYKFSIQF